MEEQKIKHDDFIHIGNNIKSIRIEKNIKQKRTFEKTSIQWDTDDERVFSEN